MIYKYKRNCGKKIKTKKIIYCKIIKEFKEDMPEKIYLVEMLNNGNLHELVNEKRLKKLNIFDKIKLILKGEYK